MARGGEDQSIFFRVVAPEKLPMSRDGPTLRHPLVSLRELGGFKGEHTELGKKGRTDKGGKSGGRFDQHIIHKYEILKQSNGGEK